MTGTTGGATARSMQVGSAGVCRWFATTSLLYPAVCEGSGGASTQLSARRPASEALEATLLQPGRKIAARASGDGLLHGHAQPSGVDPLEPFDAAIKERPDNRAVADLLTAHDLDRSYLAE
jgi:hypothetical protein